MEMKTGLLHCLRNKGLGSGELVLLVVKLTWLGVIHVLTKSPAK